MKLLLVTPYSPFQASFGAEQRSHLLLDALRTIGTVDVLILEERRSVDVVVSSRAPLIIKASWRTPMLRIGRYSVDRELRRRLADTIDLRVYDAVCARYLLPISKLEIPKGVPTIIDMDDVNYVYAPSVQRSDRLQLLLKAQARKLLERHAMKRFSAYWFVSERDRLAYQDTSGFLLPNIPFSAPTAFPRDSSDNTILFVGALWYGPNREGVERFLARSWPSVRAAVPEATLRLVGGAPVEDRWKWSSIPGVDAPGFVPDLVSEYRNASFCIAPIYSGGGTNIKVLESLVHQRACVTTTFCKSAFAPHFDAIGSLAIADDDAAFTAMCIRLLHDSTLRKTLADAGQRIVRAHFNRTVFKQAVAEGLRSLVARETGRVHF